MFGPGFLDKTNQNWKYKLKWLHWLGLGLAAVAVSQKADRLLSGVLILACFAVIVGGFALPILTIRCPACRTRLYWKGMREQRPFEFDSWLLSLTHCPVCGSDGSPADINRRRNIPSR